MNKMLKLAVSTWLLSVCAEPFSATAQGTFQNSDFESAQLSPSPLQNYPNPVPITSAMPGWTAYLGTTQQSQVQYNTTTLGEASIAVIGPTWTTINPGIIDGNYSVILQAGDDPINEAIRDNASIEQNGTVPLNAESLQLKAWNPYGALSVSFAGNVLQLIPLSSGASPSGQPYTLYGANISSFAGHTGELDFTSVFDQYFPNVVLDNVAFSTQAVPEPSPLALTGIGALLFAMYRRFAPNRR